MSNDDWDPCGPPRCDVCGHELEETEDQQGHDVLGCPLCHAKRQAQVWRGEWEKVCKEIDRLKQDLHDAGDGDTWHAAWQRCEAENERLERDLAAARAALRPFAAAAARIPEDWQDCIAFRGHTVGEYRAARAAGGAE